MDRPISFTCAMFLLRSKNTIGQTLPQTVWWASTFQNSGPECKTGLGRPPLCKSPLGNLSGFDLIRKEEWYYTYFTWSLGKKGEKGFENDVPSSNKPRPFVLGQLKPSLKSMQGVTLTCWLFTCRTFLVRFWLDVTSTSWGEGKLNKELLYIRSRDVTEGSLSNWRSTLTEDIEEWISQQMRSVKLVREKAKPNPRENSSQLQKIRIQWFDYIKLYKPENIFTCCWSIQSDRPSLSCCCWRRCARLPRLIVALPLLLLLLLLLWWLALTEPVGASEDRGIRWTDVNAWHVAGPTLNLLSKWLATAESKRPVTTADVMNDVGADDEATRVIAHLYPRITVASAGWLFFRQDRIGHRPSVYQNKNASVTTTKHKITTQTHDLFVIENAKKYGRYIDGSNSQDCTVGRGVLCCWSNGITKELADDWTFLSTQTNECQKPRRSVFITERESGGETSRRDRIEKPAEPTESCYLMETNWTRPFGRHIKWRETEN